ncbi:NtaA/DmoA family FMN-dependent monooxygenase [Nocardioides carbamazepini]|uniref:NtaA/DmoA family FMN-dependent monooxygenase n=1 Tax=Nocardioides carbamazepini TaxID=2854259 RepID=UPI002149F958|nr:NtaA/DmoA family FMN-dependent monooxygenase [Nocardioides carbamazepini]MCR1785842.1 NtaA/DmoA family FMN-dependent monooxygenase [Nocardioides carbamazepini]
MPRKMHLGWFFGFQVQSWNQVWSGDGDTDWMTPEIYVEAAQAMERARFDCMVIEDALFVPDVFRGSADWTLEHALYAPKHDPMPYVPVIAAATRHLGVIPTVTTTFYPPYLAARLLSTLDHVTRGRVGANLVMSHNDRTAQNFGYDAQREHGQRYEVGHEWAELVGRLWETWEPDAIVKDAEAGVYADPAKVHRLDYEGTWYRSRGPLNVAPSPQGRPVICQAGASPAGRDFAARFADLVICNAQGIDSMREYREDISRRLVGHGRDPGDCKVLYLVSPVLGETDAEASGRWQRMLDDVEGNIERNLAILTYYSGVDFGQFDLDAPMPVVRTNASKTTIEHNRVKSEGATLREFCSRPERGCVDLVGSPDAVAAQMEEINGAVGGDGFLIALPINRRTVYEVTDGLAPALARRGLLREAYAYPTLRENLLEF